MQFNFKIFYLFTAVLSTHLGAAHNEAANIDAAVNTANNYKEQIFVALPTDVTVTIYNDWLDIEDVAKVHMGHNYSSNKENRPEKPSDKHLNTQKQFDELKEISRDTLIIPKNADDAIFISILSKFSKVKHLSLKGCRNITDASLAYIKDISGIKSIDLSGCVGITDKGLSDIASYCENLTSLNLSGTKVTDEGLSYIAPYCENLTSLNLSGTRIRDKGLSDILLYCKNLTSLDLKSTLITDKGLSDIAPCCENLTFLNLRDTNISNNAVISISKYCNKLEHLDLTSCSNIQNIEVIFNILNDCQELKHLNLSGIQNLFGDADIDNMHNYQNLEFLDLSNTWISKNSLIHILNNCPNLIHLNLRAYSHFQDLSEVILKNSNCLNLKHLDLQENRFLTNDEIIAIAQKYSNLISLKLPKSAELQGHIALSIHDKVLTAIQEHCKQLKTLYVSKEIFSTEARKGTSFNFLEE